MPDIIFLTGKYALIILRSNSIVFSKYYIDTYRNDAGKYIDS